MAISSNILERISSWRSLAPWHVTGVLALHQGGYASGEGLSALSNECICGYEKCTLVKIKDTMEQVMRVFPETSPDGKTIRYTGIAIDILPTT